jgi:hypothetical protein
MQMQEEMRYASLVRARVPQELSDAVNATARSHFMTASEYIRQALLKSLLADGALINRNERVAA